MARALRLAILLVAAVALGSGLLIASAYLPAERVNANIGAEAWDLLDEAERGTWLAGSYRQRAEADALAMNQSVIDIGHPVVCSLTTAHYAIDHNPVADLVERAETGAAANRHDPSGWAGHVAWNRALFTLTSMSGVRLINAVLLAVGGSFLLFALWRTVSRGVAIAALLTAIPLAPPVVAYAVSTPPALVVTLAVSVAALYLSARQPVRRWDIELFAVSGMATMSADPFTVPLLTLAVPLVVVVAFQAAHAGERVARFGSPLASLLTDVSVPGESSRPFRSGLTGWQTVARGTASWLGGYAALWAAKLAINELGIAPGSFGRSLSTVGERMGIAGVDGVDLGYRFAAVGDNLTRYFSFVPGADSGLGGALVVTVGLPVVFALLWLLGARSLGVRRPSLRAGLPLLAVALMPAAWMFVVAVHSHENVASVYQLTGVTVLALAAFAITTLDWAGTSRTPTNFDDLDRLLDA